MIIKPASGKVNGFNKAEKPRGLVSKFARRGGYRPFLFN